MLVRILCIAAVASASATPAAFAAPAAGGGSGAAPACAELGKGLPAGAFAPVAYPEDRDHALRVEAKAEHEATPPSVRLFVADAGGGGARSIAAEKVGSGWKVYAATNDDGTAKARSFKLDSRRAHRLDQIVGDICLYGEPTSIGLAGDEEAGCADDSTFWLEVVTDRGRRVAAQRCDLRGLTGEAAALLQNALQLD